MLRSSVVLVFAISVATQCTVPDPPVVGSKVDSALLKRAVPPLSYPPRFMLNEPLIADELGFSKEERKQILISTQNHMRESFTRADVYKAQIKVLAAKGAVESQVERDQLTQRVRAVEQQATAELNAWLDSCLDNIQRDRLAQINLQLIGLDGIIHPDLAKSLHLSDSQLNAVAALRIELKNQATRLQEQATSAEGADENALNRKLDELRQASHAQIAKVLTDKQLQAYSAMCGKPIGFSRRDLQLKLAVQREENDRPDAQRKPVDKNQPVTSPAAATGS